MTYFRGNSTKMVTAIMMMKSKMVSLYISCPTRVSQHCGEQLLDVKPLEETNLNSRPLCVLHYCHYWKTAKMTYRVKLIVIATDTRPVGTVSDLRPQREEQNPNTGQPHEDTPERKNQRTK